MDQEVWKESKWEDANKKNVRSYNRFEGEICTEKRKSSSLVQKRKRGGKGVYSGTNEERIYSTIKFITDCTSILCRKERRIEKRG